MTIHARIYDPHAASLRALAAKNRRPVSTEVQIAVEVHLSNPSKPSTPARKRKGAGSK